MTIIDNDLLSIQEARILAENAFQAQKRLATFSQEKLDEIVECVADAAQAQADAFAVLSHEETDYGSWQDKAVKNRFVCGYARRHLKDMRCVGVISEDPANRMMDIGVPVGVVVALSPATSPVSTTIYTALIAIKSGNAVIFSPHPRARKTIGKLLDILIEVAEAKGLPEGCLTYLGTVTPAGTRELMMHKGTSLIMNTGVPGMLKAAYKAGKPVIYGGTGNGPAFIERTADIPQAVADIIASKTFDNGIVPSAEQSIVVDSCIAQGVKRELVANGAYFMSEEESQVFAALFFCPNGKLNPGMVGVSARTLALRAGFDVPDNVTVLIAERKYVSDTDPYAKEMLCPVLAYYVEDDWMHACEKCIELLVTERNGHTLVIHSNDEDVICQFALKKPVGRLLVNTPATFGGLGATTNLVPSMTLGSGSAGVGITSDNVSPLNLIYTRKVGYGVRRMDETCTDIPQDEHPSPGTVAQGAEDNLVNMQTFQRLLDEAIKTIGGSK
ncbi:aldehyde dehydrogenase family protein [Desulfoluna spongiiphila]|uniref:Acyl-CoA reductase n=1 Tax=Desulfoluna spongiiphila TaxID=419481 RepID=A0A1G5JLL2_9BACT|nr:aldehyde dehydrogenase family protein [Desulfoluna spongiiphila]SCY89217.1 Acyl-CoA reductase [Desulfoluna spongiiphila]VVS91704.1 aldehyde/histidinol dehydrogenase [Desulfoluna spongiiphila]